MLKIQKKIFQNFFWGPVDTKGDKDSIKSDSANPIFKSKGINSVIFSLERTSKFISSEFLTPLLFSRWVYALQNASIISADTASSVINKLGKVKDGLEYIGYDLFSKYVNIDASTDNLIFSKFIIDYTFNENLIKGYTSMPIGRIQSFTTSDVSSYVSRVLDYDGLVNNKAYIMGNAYVTLPVYGVGSHYNSSVLLYTALSLINLDVKPDIKKYLFWGYDRENWDDKSLIYYGDHGSNNFNGISSIALRKTKLLNSPIVIGDSCATCRWHTESSFCNLAIKQGAIGYIGNVDISRGGGSYFRFFNQLFKNKPIGLAYLFLSNDVDVTIAYLGYPDLKINYSNELNIPEIGSDVRHGANYAIDSFLSYYENNPDKYNLAKKLTDPYRES